MTSKDVILWNMAMSERFVGAYLNDLSDEELLVRPVEGQNHIAWQLGHLLSSERAMVEALKPGSCPALPAGFDEVYGRDEASTHSDDSARFLKKEQYLGLMKAQREATTAVIAGMADADLDAPSPERYRNFLPKAGDVLAMVGTHVMMHVGQFVSVRRKLKKAIAI